MIIHYNCTIGSILLHSFLLIYHPYPPSFHEIIYATYIIRMSHSCMLRIYNTLLHADYVYTTACYTHNYYEPLLHATYRSHSCMQTIILYCMSRIIMNHSCMQTMSHSCMQYNYMSHSHSYMRYSCMQTTMSHSCMQTTILL